MIFLNFFDCESSYMELTKRQFKTGVYEHILDINKRNNFSSIISNHRLNETHEFDWKYVQFE